MRSDTTDEKLTELYERHYDEVLGFCARRIGTTEAEEAAADVFAVAWRRLDEIEWETVRPWLFGIARRVVASRWRSARRQRRLLGRVSSLAPIPRELPEEQVVRRAEDEEVLNAVRGLKSVDREVLLLAAWEELTAQEIAETLTISVSAAEQRLHRAKRRLAQALQGARARHGGSATRSQRVVEEGGGR
jgi:RNA polymerase sigma-70 factor (ECF subfamily)